MEKKERVHIDCWEQVRTRNIGGMCHGIISKLVVRRLLDSKAMEKRREIMMGR